MPVPRSWWNVENIENDKDKWSTLNLFLKDLYNILNKGIVPADNFRGGLFEVTFATANADTVVEHGLGYAPLNYIVFSKSANMNVYDGAQSTTTKVKYLRSSATGTVRVFIF